MFCHCVTLCINIQGYTNNIKQPLLSFIIVNILGSEVQNYILHNITYEYNIVFIQEYRLYKSELNKMCKLDDSMAITGKSSVDECIAREGRPYGRWAILWKLSLKSAVKELTGTCNHVRLCEIMIQINKLRNHLHVMGLAGRKAISLQNIWMC